MSYILKYFYQETEGKRHQEVTLRELVDRIGVFHADDIKYKAQSRIAQNQLPQVKEFRTYQTPQVIVKDLTTRGNIFVEVWPAA